MRRLKLLSLTFWLVLACSGIAQAQGSIDVEKMYLGTYGGTICGLAPGIGAPSGGATCDLYIDSTGDFWTKHSGTWTVLPRLEANNLWTGVNTLVSSEPILNLYESDQGSNLKLLRFELQGGILNVQTLNDAGSSVLATLLALTRTGDLGILGNFAVNTNKFNVTASSGDTAIAGALTVTGAASAAALVSGTNTTQGPINLNGPAASNRDMRWQTAGVNRWQMRTTNTAEGGSNAGSNFQINAIDDSGATIGAALAITRSTMAATFGGALTVTGVTTFTAQPVLSSLTASQAVFTDGSKGLVSNAITGSGNVVMSASPTLTGTIAGASETLSGTLGVTSTATFGANLLPSVNYVGNLGATATKFKQAHIAELVVETLVAQSTTATIGGRVIIAPTNTLTADLAAVGTTMTVKYNNFTNGDRIRLEAEGKLEWMAVASVAGGSAGAYTYTVTRNLDGTGADQWYAGDAAVDTGTTGNGFIDLYSTGGVLSGNGPTIVGNVRTGTAYSNVAPRWAIGNLDGLYSYSGSTYGAAFGDSANTWLAIDTTNGLRGMSGSTVRFQIAANGSGRLANGNFTWDASGNVAIVGSATIGGWTIGSTTITGGSVTIDSAGDVRAGQTAYATGTGFWLGVDSGTPKFSIGSSTKSLTWNGTSFVLTSPDMTLGSATAFTSASALKFARDTTFDANQIYGLWGQGSGSAYQDLVLENYASRSSIGNAQSTVYLRATGWGGGGAGAALAAAEIRARSDPSGGATIVATAANGTFLVSASTVIGTDSATLTQANSAVVGSSNSEGFGLTGGTSTLVNFNFYADTGTNGQRRATIQAIRAGASNRGGAVQFYTKDDTASGTDVVLAGYIDFSTGGAGGGLVWGAPTGGGCGAGCINAKSVRDDGVVLTDWVFEDHFGVPDDQRVVATPKGKRLYTLAETRDITMTEHRLPWMPTPETFERERGVGGMLTRLWNGQEQQQIYFDGLDDRIKALESQVTQLKAGVKQ